MSEASGAGSDRREDARRLAVPSGARVERTRDESCSRPLRTTRSRKRASRRGSTCSASVSTPSPPRSPLRPLRWRRRTARSRPFRRDLEARDEQLQALVAQAQAGRAAADELRDLERRSPLSAEGRGSEEHEAARRPSSRSSACSPSVSTHLSTPSPRPPQASPVGRASSPRSGKRSTRRTSTAPRRPIPSSATRSRALDVDADRDSARRSGASSLLDPARAPRAEQRRVGRAPLDARDASLPCRGSRGLRAGVPRSCSTSGSPRRPRRRRGLAAVTERDRRLAATPRRQPRALAEKEQRARSTPPRTSPSRAPASSPSWSTCGRRSRPLRRPTDLADALSEPTERVESAVARCRVPRATDRAARGFARRRTMTSSPSSSRRWTAPRRRLGRDRACEDPLARRAAVARGAPRRRRGAAQADGADRAQPVRSPTRKLRTADADDLLAELRDSLQVDGERRSRDGASGPMDRPTPRFPKTKCSRLSPAGHASSRCGRATP